MQNQETFTKDIQEILTKEIDAITAQAESIKNKEFGLERGDLFDFVKSNMDLFKELLNKVKPQERLFECKETAKAQENTVLCGDYQKSSKFCQYMRFLRGRLYGILCSEYNKEYFNGAYIIEATSNKKNKHRIYVYPSLMEKKLINFSYKHTADQLRADEYKKAMGLS